MESVGNKAYAQQPLQYSKQVSGSTQTFPSSKNPSFFTPKRIAMLGAAALVGATGVLYLVLRKTPLPYKSCEGFEISGDKWGQNLAHTLKTAYSKACEGTGGSSSQIVAKIDGHLKEGRYGYGLIKDQFMFRIGLPYGAPMNIDPFVTSSCLTKDGFLKKELFFELTVPCDRYLGKSDATGDEYLSCNANYQYYIDRAISNLQQDCDS